MIWCININTKRINQIRIAEKYLIYDYFLNFQYNIILCIYLSLLLDGYFAKLLLSTGFNSNHIHSI
jgi:hypothetical protein